MITLTYKHINNHDFSQAMRKLFETQGLPVKTAYTISKLVYKIDLELKHASEIFKNILKEFCEVNEKGEIVTQSYKLKNEAGEEVEQTIPGTYKCLPGKEEELEKKLEDFMSISFDLHYNPILLEDIAKADKLSAKDISMLDPIINQLEEVK